MTSADPHRVVPSLVPLRPAPQFGAMTPTPVDSRRATNEPLASPSYQGRLGTFSGTMLVVGGIIGSGIFLSPAVVAQRVGSGTLTLSAWALGAVVALIGGFIYAELGARRPLAGGTYVYLREAWGPLPAFLYGWALFLIIGTGAIAAVAMTGASYLTVQLQLEPWTVRPVAIAIIVVMTALNILGVGIGAVAGNVLTLLKLAAIAVLVLAALMLAPAHEVPKPLHQVVPLVPTGVMGIFAAMGSALAPVLFAFGGWQQTNAVAEELENPTRTLPRALILGVLITVATYLLVNVAYLRALGAAGLASSLAPAADAMFVYLGAPGRIFISFGIVVSTVGFLGAVILMSARVYQAMAADGLFFSHLAALHPKTRTPVAALLAQCAVSLVLLVSGTYGQLLDYVVFADWIFFGATAAALFVLRTRDDGRGLRVGTRTPLHPWSTLLFIAASLYVVAGSIFSNPSNAARGAGLLALGLPVYAYWRRQGAGAVRE